MGLAQTTRTEEHLVTTEAETREMCLPSEEHQGSAEATSVQGRCTAQASHSSFQGRAAPWSCW